MTPEDMGGLVALPRTEFYKSSLGSLSILGGHMVEALLGFSGVAVLVPITEGS